MRRRGHKMSWVRLLPETGSTIDRLLAAYEAAHKAHREAEERELEAEYALLDAVEQGWTEAEIRAAQRQAWGVDDAPAKRSTSKKKTAAKKTTSKAKTTSRKSRRKPRCEACNSTDLEPSTMPGTDPALEYECQRCGRIGGWEGAR